MAVYCVNLILDPTIEQIVFFQKIRAKIGFGEPMKFISFTGVLVQHNCELSPILNNEC